jgi:hypothetical protein
MFAELKIRSVFEVGVVCALLAPAPSVHAHHSWSTNYDASRTIAVTGVIARMVFRNPHSSIVLAVRNDVGEVEQWIIEWGSPQGLRERGVDQNTLRAGDALRVRGDPHRNPKTRSIHMESLIRLSDGMRISGQDGSILRGSAASSSGRVYSSTGKPTMLPHSVHEPPYTSTFR